jgi:hypothetical protein
MTLTHRKYELIRRITELQDEGKLAELEAVVADQAPAEDLRSRFPDIFKPTRKTIDLETLKREQNWQGFDREEFDRLCDELAFDQDSDKSLEELIAEI